MAEPRRSSVAPHRALLLWSCAVRHCRSAGARHCSTGGAIRLLGAFLVLVVVWRRLRPHPHPPRDSAFVAVGAGSGLGSALLGSVGPLTAPFFLARGLRRDAYIGTEAACALAMHLTKTAAHGSTDLLSGSVLLLGLALTPATLAASTHGSCNQPGQSSTRALQWV